MIVIVVSVIACLAWIVSDAKDEFVFLYMTDRDGICIEALGGNLTSLGEDLIETDKFLNGNNFFATYASAQEVVSDVYQPSGTDYIIHVLGNKQREKYLVAFNAGEFKYVATIKEDYTDWEYWIRRANWYFYRELYATMHPVYSNTYEVYWEKNKDEHISVNKEIQFSIIDIDETSKKLVVQTDESVNGIADVYIDYTVNKNERRSSLLVFQKALLVTDTEIAYNGSEFYCDSNYLRAESKEYIPVSIVNGYGEVTLSSEPARNTVLQLNEASCDRIYTCTSEYLEILDVSINENESTIRIANTLNNVNAISGATHIELQENGYEIVRIEKDDFSIYVEVNSIIQYDKSFGNYMKIN